MFCKHFSTSRLQIVGLTGVNNKLFGYISCYILANYCYCVVLCQENLDISHCETLFKIHLSLFLNSDFKQPK